MVKLSDVAKFPSCITCGWRQFYPPARAGSAEPVFFRFHCQMAPESGKGVVRPEDVCDHWRGVTLGFE